MRSMYDAAQPPSNPPKTDIVAGYIGGDTPHVWTDAEWSRQTATYRLPIYVRSNPGSHSANSDAHDAVDWLTAHNVPKGCTVALDFETAVNGPYVRDFDAVMISHGYRTILYGSRSTVFNNPKPSGGYWDAIWNGIDHVSPDAEATQWVNREPIDLSTVRDSVVLWNVKGVDVMAGLQVLKLGSSGLQVKILQTLLNEIWQEAPEPKITVSGVFDAATQKRVEQEQAQHALSSDGVVGPKTWGLLLDA